jgi:hypothetical protein
MTREEALDVINSRNLSEPVANALLDYVTDPVNLGASAASLLSGIPGVGTAINFADTLVSPSSYTYSALPGGIDNPYGPEGQYGYGTLGNTGLSITPDMVDVNPETGEISLKGGPQGYGYNLGFDGLSGRTFAEQGDIASEAERKGMYASVPAEDLGVGFDDEYGQSLAEQQLQDDLAREEETDYFDQGIIGRDNQGALIDNAVNNLVGGLLSNQGPTVGLLGPSSAPNAVTQGIIDNLFQPYDTFRYKGGAVDMAPLAPPSPADTSDGGTLTGDEDWSGAYDADAPGFL